MRILTIIAYYRDRDQSPDQIEQYETMLGEAEQVTHKLISSTIEAQLTHLDHILNGLKLKRSSASVIDLKYHPDIVPRPTPSL